MLIQNRAYLILIVFLATFFVTPNAFCGHNNGAPRFALLPEWKAKTAVVVDLETTFERVWNADLNKVEGSPAALFERLTMLKILSETLGPRKLILLGSQTSINRVQNWLASVGRLNEFQSVFKIPVLNNKPVDAEDEWTRDYIGFPVKANGGGGIAILNPRGESATKKISQFFSLPIHQIVENEVGIDGGNLAVDENGTCFSTADLSLEIRMGLCSRVYTVPALPFEGTRHIDLFMKPIGLKKVLLSEYADDQVEVLQQHKITSYRCPEEINKNSKDFDFVTMCSSDSTDAAEDDFTLVSKDGETFRISISEVPQFVRSMTNSKIDRYFAVADGRSSDTPMDEVDWSRSFVSHSHDLREILEKSGFTVVSIKAPRPLVRLAESVYRSANGEILRRELSLELVFRSYTNALQFGGYIFMPSYKHTVDSATEVNLRDQLEALKLRPVFIPANYSSMGGGAVHCLTREL